MDRSQGVNSAVNTYYYASEDLNAEFQNLSDVMDVLESKQSDLVHVDKVGQPYFVAAIATNAPNDVLALS